MNTLTWINSVVTEKVKIISSKVFINPCLSDEEQLLKAFEYFFGDDFKDIEVGRIHIGGNGYVEATISYTYFVRKSLFAKFQINNSTWELTYWRKEE